MPGKNIVVCKTCRVNGKRLTPGSKAQVSAELYKELVEKNLVLSDAEVKAKAEAESEKAK